MKDAILDIHDRDFILPKREAYREIGRIASQTNDPNLINLAPLYREEIVHTVDNSLSEFTGLSLSKSKPIDAVLAKFGLIGEVKSSTPRATKILIEGADGATDTITVPKGITPLTIANSDDFRRQILANFSVNEPVEREAARRVSAALDKTIDDVVGQFEKIDGMPAEVLKQVRKARALARKEKVVFNQKDLVNDLVSYKKGALDNPTVAASEVFGKINKARAEDIDKFRKLMLSTEDGAQAWANHQAATVANILADALNSGSKVTSPLTGDSIQSMTNTSLKRAISKSFRDKSGAALNALFRDRPDVLRELRKIQKALELTTPTSTSVPRGSLDAVNRLISMMGRTGNALKDVASFVQVKSQARSNLKQSIDLRPSMQEIKEYIEFSMPRFASEYFGSGVAAQQATETEQ